MSGGHFGHKQYEIQLISEEIELLIENNHDKTPDFSVQLECALNVANR